MSELSPVQDYLRSLMSDVSEECYAAGWMTETEHAVWELINGRRTRWGQCDRAEVEELLVEIEKVANQCGFWIIWDIDTQAERAVPLAEWGLAYEHGRKVAGL